MTSTVAIVVQGIQITWEMIVLGGLLLSGIIYGFTVGRDRSITVLLSTYVAFAIVTNAPLLGRLTVLLGIQQSPWLTVFWFIGIFLAVFLVLWRSALLRSLSSSRGSWWETLLFSILQVGLMLSIFLYLMPKEVIAQLSFVTAEAFLAEQGRTFWLLAPLIFLAILGRNEGGFDEDLND